VLAAAAIWEIMSAQICEIRRAREFLPECATHTPATRWTGDIAQRLPPPFKNTWDFLVAQGYWQAGDAEAQC